MNIFQFAQQMEKDGEEYYLHLAQDAPDKGMKTIFEGMAADEAKHFKLFKEMEEKADPKMAASPILADAKNVFQEMKEQKVSFEITGNQVDAYRKAQELEKKGEDYYRQKAEEVDNPKHKELFIRIADEEVKHFKLLESVIDFVSRPETWLESAEFGRLDEY